MNTNVIFFIFMIVYLLIDVFCISRYKKKIKDLQEQNSFLQKRLDLSNKN